MKADVEAACLSQKMGKHGQNLVQSFTVKK